MRGLPAVSPGAQQRARRWDALVLGTALPGLVSAVRLAMHGVRVLVLEEEAGSRAFAGLREPFHLTGAGGASLLGMVLQALGMALIDRRRFDAAPVAYQVVLPEARIDVGEPKRLAAELVAWGLAKPDAARSLLRALAESSAAERDALLAAPLVPAGRRLPRGAQRPAAGASLPATAPRHARGLPAEVRSAEGMLRTLLAAQVRALSNLGGSEPSPEAAARLLGVALEGGAAPNTVEMGLRALLRRRIETLYGEFRSLPDRFRLVTAARQPGVEPAEGRDLWLGRALVLNAPHAALAACLGEDAPSFLAAPVSRHRRRAVHLQAPPEVIPEGMAPRLIRIRDPEAPLEGTNLVRLQRWRGRRERDPVELVASAVVPADDPDPAAREAEIEAAVAELMPFAGEQLKRQPVPELRWDTDAWLADPPPGGGAWPADVEVRLAARPPLFSLERSGVAGLGVEGDLLLGWRAGDAIAAELA